MLFTWHLNVIKSCKTIPQLLVARKLLRNSRIRKLITRYEYRLLRAEAYENNDITCSS